NLNNPQIRAIRKLRKRRERERRGAMLVEGRRALGVAIRAGSPVIELVHTPGAREKRLEMVRAVRASGAKVLEVSPEVMASLTGVGSVPDVVGVVPLLESSLEEAASAFGFGAVLAGVHDPAAAGSILASCAAAGGSVAIGTTGTTDRFAPKPVRSAGGAHFLMRVAAGVDPTACAESLRSAGVRLVTLDPEGEDLATSTLSEPLAVVVGEEGSVPEPLAASVLGRVRIGDPEAGIRPPLAAEAAVVLFEAGRRRRNGNG
ncbi:MAG: TrmH family RNA methyltransferase, partial [Actinomycetota bacterium]